jgi:hypothetical protein
MDEDHHQDMQREDHPVVRLFAYTFGIVSASILAAGFMFLLQTGVLFRPIAKYNMRDAEASNERILHWTKLAACAGAAGGIWYSVRYEIMVRKRRR